MMRLRSKRRDGGEAGSAGGSDEPTDRADGAKQLRAPILIRRVCIGLGLGATVLIGLTAWGYRVMIWMPGRSHQGPVPALGRDGEEVRDKLRRDVERLATVIGGRAIGDAERGLAEAAEFVEAELSQCGYDVERQTFEVQGRPCRNLIAEIRGKRRPEEIVVIGAHYDSHGKAPAADDNASGVAATLALARHFAGGMQTPGRTLRFVLFANEEPPFFQTDAMGSRVYARRCRNRGEIIVAMLSLETVGYFTDQPGSQKYPFPLSAIYPTRGNFIAFVGDLSSRNLVRQVVGSFRSRTPFPSEGAALPSGIRGVGWSDHWSFWQEGYPAVMVTDTAPFRNPHYHTPQDTPEKLDFDRTARVVGGLVQVTRDLALVESE